MNCRLCLTVAVAHTRGPRFDICDTCAATLGVFEVGPPRRPARPCDRCNGMQFVRVVPREKGAHTSSFGTDTYAQATIEPFALAFAPHVTMGLLGGVHVHVPEASDRTARGILETYVCVTCGFVEWYCLDHRNIPLGPEYMADFVDYGTAPEPDPKP
jgi:hypothetical protein